MMNDNNIDTLINEISADFCQDQNKKSASSKEKSGRKNKGQTFASYEDKKEELRKTYKTYHDIKQNDDFGRVAVEKVQGEIVQKEDIESFSFLYKEVCLSCLTEFKENNAELCKKHPSNWYNQVMIEIKKNTPKITAKELGRCVAVWDCIKDFLFSLGLCPSYELFEYMTNIYKYQLEEQAKLNSKYRDFLQKIYNDCRGGLIINLTNNPYTQTNKYYLGKSIYNLVEKSEPKQIEVTHNIQNFDNISAYRLKDGKNDE